MPALSGGRAPSFGYFYDGVNRLKRADGFGGSTFFEYDAAGRRTSELRPNGVRTAWGYDDGSQLLSMVHSKAGAVVLGFTYDYNGHGMRVSKGREDGSKEVYGYDPGDRLTAVDYGTTKHVDYFLDALGNRTLEDTTSPGQPLIRNGFVLNVFNQLVTSGGPGSSFPVTTYGYDLNGNLLSETRTPSGFPAEVTTYSWTRDNRLSFVAPPTGPPTSYAYDARGLRVQRVDGTGTTRYLLDGSSVLEELDAATATTTKYFNNPQKIDEVLAYQRGSATEYPLTDALGSLYASTDASGNVVHRYDFDVYGKRTDLGGSAAAVDRGFTMREHDANGQRFGRDRYADALTGRWSQPDRAGMVNGANLYNYVSNNPVMFNDPSGFLLGPYPPVVVDTWSATAVYHPLLFLALLVALGDLPESVPLNTTNSCKQTDPNSLETFYRGDSLPRAQLSVTDGFVAAGIGTEQGSLGAGLYMSRDPDVAVGYASVAFAHFGSGAILQITIATPIWRVVQAMGALDNAPIYASGVQSFVPTGPALQLFDSASLKQIITSRTR